MEEFSTFIFQENKTKTNNRRVLKERTFYIGILVFLIGICLLILEIEWAGSTLLMGVFITIAGRILASGKEPSVGYRPMELKLRGDSIFIGTDKIVIKNKSDVSIKIVGYKGEPISLSQSLPRDTWSGNENTIRLLYNAKVVQFNFVIESERQKQKLIDFCEEHGFGSREKRQSLMSAISWAFEGLLSPRSARRR